ncbi:MAG: CPBP family intramembrane glutamate endopeptidase, partial [Lentilactobacillus hilgardii]
MDENKRLKAGDYFERIGIFVGLVIIVIFVQFPLSFIMMGDFSHLVNNIIAVVYILGFVLSIAVAGYFYRKYAHPKKMSLTSRDISMIFIAYVSFFVVQIGLGLLNQAIYHQSSTANNKIIYQYMNTN